MSWQRPTEQVSLDDDVLEQEEPAPDASGLSSNAVAAIIENRAKEIGIAFFDGDEATLYLTQFAETSRTYTTATRLLQVQAPSALVIVASTQGLSSGINLASRAFHQIPMSRGSFDDTKGSLAVQQCATEQSRAELEEATQRTAHYLALGAAGALLAYLQQEKHMVLGAGSVHVSIMSPASFVHIDSATVDALELVKPLRAAKQRSKATTLYNLLNHTKTASGATLLRANILQPLTHVGTLNLRYEAVEELLASEEMHVDTVQALQALPRDLDKVCRGLSIKASSPKKDPAQRIAALVQSVILVKETLTAMPGLAKVLAPAQSELLKAVGSSAAHPVFAELAAAISAVLDEDVQSSKTPFVSRMQQCFAVKTGRDSFLDLARANFCRISEDIHKLAATYSEQFSLNLKLQYAAKRGFYLSTPKPKTATKQGGPEVPPLPKDFIQVDAMRSRSTVTCTTHKLNALNSRLSDASSDCLVLTEQILEGTVATVCREMDALHRLINSIALLDVLQSFATVVNTAPGTFVRPKMSERGPLAIVEGRHPLMEQLQGSDDFVPNDTYLADCSSFHIISGPNMAGKSTYLRQVAMIAVMAHAGCFVPAKFAAMQVMDRLLTRLGSSDCIEHNSSSFLMEMQIHPPTYFFLSEQETAHIVNSATERSLILIDELGKSTSTADGTAIAWAVSEELIGLGAYTLFATHFTALSELAELYPNAKLWHFSVESSAQGLHYGHKLLPGQHQSAHYGLLLAPVVGVLEEVTQEAYRIAELVEQADSRATCRSAMEEAEELRAVYSMAHRVMCIAQAAKDKPDGIDVRKQLGSLKREAMRVLRRDTSNFIC